MRVKEKILCLLEDVLCISDDRNRDALCFKSNHLMYYSKLIFILKEFGYFFKINVKNPIFVFRENWPERFFFSRNYI